jgi:hypothetical protein
MKPFWWATPPGTWPRDDSGGVFKVAAEQCPRPRLTPTLLGFSWPSGKTLSGGSTQGMGPRTPEGRALPMPEGADAAGRIPPGQRSLAKSAAL